MKDSKWDSENDKDLKDTEIEGLSMIRNKHQVYQDLSGGNPILWGLNSEYDVKLIISC